MRKSILIDLDDVICNWAFMWAVNKSSRKNFTYENAKEYMLPLLLQKESHRRKFYEIVFNKDIYKHAVLLPDAYDVLKKLNDIFDIYITTASVIPFQSERSGKYFKTKYNYLVKTLPFLDPKKFVFTNSKDILVGDIQIDDKVENLQGKYVKRKLLFDSYHNKNINKNILNSQGIQRVSGWKEIEKLLID